ncbi:MAG: Monogalactosyldiacylglycerol synthase [Thermoleophilia bacterium]|nr:Monogalactosyldiacylglycerol synthase [Thermoleophilia bacterium]
MGNVVQTGVTDPVALRAARRFGELATDAAVRVGGAIRRQRPESARAAVEPVPGAPLRVRIYSADLGSGHDAMANAIKGELLTRYGDGVSVEVRNGLQVGNRGLHRFMRDGYAAQLKYAPGSYGTLYNLLANPVAANVGDGVTSALLAPGLLRDIEANRPDVVMSTFPHVTAALGNLRATGHLDVPTVGVVIDSNPHAAWVHHGIDQHVVLNGADLPRIAAFGSAEAPVRGRAIRPPVDARHFAPVDRAAARAEFGLPQDGRVLLVSGGGWGLALPDEELRRIIDSTDLHVAVATARNTEAFDHLRATFPADRLTPIPFTREMPRLLGASDAVLTNSGGMTSLETFAHERPVILYRPLPGHGVDGADALQADGLATHARTTGELLDALQRFEAGDDPDLAARVVRARGLFDAAPASDVVAELAHREARP